MTVTKKTAAAPVKPVKVSQSTRAGWLRSGAAAAAGAAAAMAEAKASGASALDLMTAGLASEAVLSMSISFVTDGEKRAASLRDYLAREKSGAAFRNAGGALSTVALGAFKDTVMQRFGIARNDDGGNAAVWALFQAKALPLAAAFVGCGAVVSIREQDGKNRLHVAGPKGSPLVAAAQKSTSAAVKLAKGEVTSRAPKGAVSAAPPTGAASDGVSLRETFRQALKVLREAKAGREALSEAALSDVRELARLATEVAGNA